MAKNRVMVFLVITTLILVACGLFASPDSSSGTPEGDNPDRPVSPTEVPSLESPVSDDDVFPLVPDPINVTATLETENTATYKKGSYNTSLKTESSDGVVYKLDLLKDTLFMEDENGDLTIDYKSNITMTPVSAIDGLPFSQGYLAAVHLGPDGAQLLRSADLSMGIPAEYDSSTLIGFAADGTGEDFHLYPASFYSLDGKTYAQFDVTHFSLYGVAQVTQSEILAVKKHPPIKPASQVDQDLAPLPDPKEWQKNLQMDYDKLINPKVGKISDTSCDKVAGVVKDYNEWEVRVVRAGLKEAFSNDMVLDQNAMLNRLKDCIRVTCDTCLSPQKGSVLDQKAVTKMVSMIHFAIELSGKLNAGDEVSNNWWQIMYKCSKNAGLPLPVGGIAADGGSGGGEKVSCP